MPRRNPNSTGYVRAKIARQNRAKRNPSTTPDRRKRWSGGDQEAIAYLESRDYTLEDDWSWSPPFPGHSPTEKEKDAIIYLIEEWDFDGLRAKRNSFTWGGPTTPGKKWTAEPDPSRPGWWLVTDPGKHGDGPSRYTVEAPSKSAAIKAVKGAARLTRW